MLYVNESGKLTEFKIDNRELLRITRTSDDDVQEILKIFHVWAGYFPHESQNCETDFHNFIKYCLQDERLRLKAAAVLNLYMSKNVLEG